MDEPGQNKPCNRETNRSEWAGLSIFPKDFPVRENPHGEDVVRHHRGGCTAGQMKKSFKKEELLTNTIFRSFRLCHHNGQKESGKKEKSKPGSKKSRKGKHRQTRWFCGKMHTGKNALFEVTFFPPRADKWPGHPELRIRSSRKADVSASGSVRAEIELRAVSARTVT